MGSSVAGAAARAYHRATSHSLESLSANRHGLDWPNQPLPFKIYTSLEPLSLSVSIEQTPERGGTLDRAALGQLCRYSNGVTRVIRRHGQEMPFRAAACTGALYHIELYLVTQDLPQLEAGVYHYAAHDHSLRQLRTGDFRRVLVDATGAEPSIAAAPAVFVCTSTYWRNAWKYVARAYRHCFWDCGTMLANLFGVADAHSLPARLILSFSDSTVNALLDVEPTQEAALCLIALGAKAASSPAPPPVQPLNLPTQRLSPSQVDYPLITEMHAASSLASGADAAAWRSAAAQLRAAPEGAPPLPTHEPLEAVIRRRGSSRRFLRDPIRLPDLEAILHYAARRVPSDLGSLELCDTYLIVNAVDGLQPGSYVLDAAGNPQLLRAGDFRDAAGFLDLGQELAADAAVNVYTLCNLEPVLDALGDRGYRAAQFEGGIHGGKLYLASYALGLGATGLTFFDDDVTRFFSPHAEGKSVMFLTAFGHPSRRRPVTA